MVQNSKVHDGIQLLVNLAVTQLLPQAKSREVARQKAHNQDQDLFDLDDAGEDRAKDVLEFGISQRLKGAYACYEAGFQLECLRLVMLALGTIAETLGWDKVTSYISEQNRVLLMRSEVEREAR